MIYQITDVCIAQSYRGYNVCDKQTHNRQRSFTGQLRRQAGIYRNYADEPSAD